MPDLKKMILKSLKFSVNHSNLFKVVFLFLFSCVTASAQTYYWNVWNTTTTASSGFFHTPSNWVEASGTVPTSLNDTGVYIVDATLQGTRTTGNTRTTIKFNNPYSIGQFKITRGTTVELESDQNISRTITIIGGVGDDFVIENGSTLELTDSWPVAITFSGDGNTGVISGTYRAGGNVNNKITTTDGTNTVVTITDTGMVYNQYNAPNGALLGSSTTLFFNSGSYYEHSYTNVNAGYIPSANWDTASTIKLRDNFNSSGTNNSIINNTSGQSFGNFIFSSNSSAQTEFLAGNGNAVVKGDFTISNTNERNKFIATKEGVLTINGNLEVKDKTVFEASYTGTLNVLGNIKINAGFDVAAGSSSKLYVKGNIEQVGGVFWQTQPSGILEFNGTTSQTFSPKQFKGAAYSVNVDEPFNININNPAGVVLTTPNNSPLPVWKVTITSGTITGTGSMKYVTNSGTPILIYAGSSSQTATEMEFPQIDGPHSLTINNTASAPNNVVNLPFSRTLNAAGTLTLTAGILDNSNYVLTVPNTDAGSVVGGSGSSYIKGTLERSLPANLASGSTYSFPLGKSAYNPFALVNPTTTGVVSVMAEVFDGPTGGTLTDPLTQLNQNRYWTAAITAGVDNFTNTLIKLSDTPNGANAIASSTALTGAYSAVGGNLSTSTDSSLQSKNPSSSIDGFYVMASGAIPVLATPTISPSGNQCENVAREISVLITPGRELINSVILNYSINGIAQSPINMTNSTNYGGFVADTWTATIPLVTPSDALVTWSISLPNNFGSPLSVTGTPYQDELSLVGISATATGTEATVCIGSPSTLSMDIIKPITVIGTGENLSGSGYPPAFHQRYPGLRSQVIYTADELIEAGLEAGEINSITYNITTLGESSDNEFTIKIGSTAKDFYSSDTEYYYDDYDFESTQNYTTVFGPTAYTHTANGLQTIEFERPYVWDGVSNIIVDVYQKRDINITSVGWPIPNSSTYYSLTTSNKTLLRIQETDSDNILDGVVWGELWNWRPDIIFNNNQVKTFTASSYSWSDGEKVVGTTRSI